MPKQANLQLLCAIWATLCACGSGAPEVSAESFALERARALCEQRSACCQDDADFDADSCARAEADDYRTWMMSLRADFMPDAAASCLAAYRASCSASDSAVEQACAPVWKGRQPVDGDCTQDAECAPVQGLRARCRTIVDDDLDDMMSSTSSHCEPDEHARENFIRVDAGHTCRAQCNAGPAGRCTGQVGQESPTPACFEEDGLICIEGHCERLPGTDADCVLGRCDSRVSFCDADNRCRERQAADSTCRYSGECADGLFCAPDTATCQRLLDLGEACEDASECASGACATQCVEMRPLLCEPAHG